MTETLPPRMEGQISAPNPIELFWEKNRRAILAILVVLLVALVASYAWQYMQQAKVDMRWSAFAAATNFDAAYTADGSTASTLKNPDLDRMLSQVYPGWITGVGGYALRTNDELLSKLEDHLRSANLAEIQRGRDELRGTSAEPLMIWIQAQRAAVDRRWDDALALLNELEQRFPSHYLVKPSRYPVQFRAEVEKTKEEREKEKAKEKEQGPRVRREKPVLVPPIAGKSHVELAREQIEAERKFQMEHARLFTPPEPDADSATAVIKTSEGEFKVRFYQAAAPKAVESFQKLAKEKWYDGMRVHEVRRPGTVQDAFSSNDRPAEFSFGLPASREDDRSKWVTTDKSGVILDFEQTVLSHFPYMVAFAPEAEGKSSGERVWICATDAAKTHDGDRVVFGRVVEGQETVDRITQILFATTAEDERGEGKPRDNIVIESITIL